MQKKLYTQESLLWSFRHSDDVEQVLASYSHLPEVILTRCTWSTRELSIDLPALFKEHWDEQSMARTPLKHAFELCKEKFKAPTFKQLALVAWDDKMKLIWCVEWSRRFIQSEFHHKIVAFCVEAVHVASVHEMMKEFREESEEASSCAVPPPWTTNEAGNLISASASSSSS